MLTDTACRKAVPGEKDRKLYDERGLYLLVKPAGAKLWRQKYRFGGKEKKLSTGRTRRSRLRRLARRGTTRCSSCATE